MPGGSSDTGKSHHMVMNGWVQPDEKVALVNTGTGL